MGEDAASFAVGEDYGVAAGAIDYCIVYKDNWSWVALE